MEEKVPAGYAEIVDTFNDALDIFEMIGQAILDGFQITDLAVLLQAYPKAQEIYLDRHRFKTEIADLDPSELKSVYEELSVMRGAKLSWVEDNALFAIKTIAKVYQMYDDGTEVVFDVRERFKRKEAA